MALKQKHIGVLVGSLRRDSFSRKLASALIARAPAAFDCALIEIADLPLYNEDLEAAPPAAWSAFREAIRSGCLKNATDVGSRPEGKNVFAGLPAAIVSVSPYSLGGFGANHALRQSFVYLDLAVMQQPEAYVGDVGDVMDAQGTITNEKTDVLLTEFMHAFERWAGAVGVGAKESFEAFLTRREAISGDYIGGKWEPLLDISTMSDPATFFPPSGDRLQGASKVNAANQQGAKAFAPGSVGRFEVLQSGSSGALGFWTGIQHAEVMMKGKDKPVSMQLRTTEVFRAEQGVWKLIHRHADIGRGDK